ncbi:hypothetical protein WJX81_004717 [Elliptochloris bilobata]|uniref:Thioredoxin domain-containing protein n=1 Tax=Elliptochloris bilobata TaxID=381761 RepID=A0AAW1SI74_9CHLO
MKDVHSVQEFVDELAQAGDRLVIVDFYAKWCNACRALFPKLCQLCNDNPDILLLKVDFDENRDIVKALAIRVLPFFHLYRGANGKVAEFSASVSKIQRLRDALALHGGPRCTLGGEATGADLHDVFPDVEPHLHPEQANNVVARTVANYPGAFNPSHHSMALFPPKNIVIAIDGTEASKDAVNYALLNLYRPGDEFHLACVIIDETDQLRPYYRERPLEDAANAFIQENLVPQLIAANVTTVVDILRKPTADSHPGEAIVRLADKLKASTIVIAPHKHEFLDSLYHQSVTKYVMAKAHTTVAVVHPSAGAGDNLHSNLKHVSMQHK